MTASQGRFVAFAAVALVAFAAWPGIARASRAGDPVSHNPVQPWPCCRGPIFPIYGCRGPAEPLPTPPPPPPNPGEAGRATYRVCPNVAARIPPAVQAYALANPHAIEGYGLRLNPNVPANPWNKLRTWLTLRDIGKPWNECNSVVWKAGCP